jgi:hypothetical protein
LLQECDLEVSTDGSVQLYSFVGFFLIGFGLFMLHFPKNFIHSAHTFVRMAELISSICFTVGSSYGSRFLIACIFWLWQYWDLNSVFTLAGQALCSLRQPDSKSLSRRLKLGLQRDIIKFATLFKSFVYTFNHFFLKI